MGCGKSDYTEQLRKDLFEAFFRELASTKTVEEAITNAVESPAKCFYVSQEAARRECMNLLHGRGPKSREATDCRYREILRRALQMKLENLDIPIIDAIGKVIDQPAPRFYITKASAKTYISLYYKTRRKCKPKSASRSL